MGVETIGQKVSRIMDKRTTKKIGQTLKCCWKVREDGQGTGQSLPEGFRKLLTGP
jgi:hypothetical protein